MLDSFEVPDYLGRLRLDGDRIVVLGAGQGIGRQVSHALSQAGARLLLVDLDGGRAKEIAAEVGGIPESGDMTVRDDLERVVATALDPNSGLGGLDGLVDIIGLTRWVSILDSTDEDYEWLLDINLRHVYMAIRCAGRAMSTNGGKMAFVSSTAGWTASPNQAAYGAAKAGLMSLVRTAAIEMAPMGIRVNAVAPGAISTPRLLESMSAELRQANLGNVPLGRIGNPADVAGALLFLMSDLASFVTGETVVVDGGILVKFPFPDPTKF